MEIPSFVSKSRLSTPACNRQLFFNSAGSSLISTATKKVMLDYLNKEIEIGGYDVMMECEDETNEFYKEAAKLINAEPQNLRTKRVPRMLTLRCFIPCLGKRTISS